MTRANKGHDQEWSWNSYMEVFTTKSSSIELFIIMINEVNEETVYNYMYKT